MYDTAASVHVIETEENLFRDLFDEGHGDAFVLMALDEAEEVFTKDLKNHADVGAVGPFVSEVVEERDDMGAARVGVGWGRRGMGEGGRGGDGWGGGGDEALEEFDLVEGSLGIAGGGFDDLEGDMAVHSGRGISWIEEVDDGTHFRSFASHTVEKWPQPSFRTTWYRSSEKVSPILTGWYPPCT